MKNLHKKAILKIESLGAEEVKYSSRNYTHKIKTIAGNLYLKIEVCKALKMNTLFGNFLDDPKKAKMILGHWKYNMHTDSKNDFLEAIEIHINAINKFSPFSDSRKNMREVWNKSNSNLGWNEFLESNL